MCILSLTRTFNISQVQHFHGWKFTITLGGETLEIEVTAIAINEDNNDPNLFVDLEKGRIRLLFASPECLLRNMTFKQLFCKQGFRSHVLAVFVDECHVIEMWKDDF